MGKEVKTNAMRILDRQKIPYQLIPTNAGSLLTESQLRTSLDRAMTCPLKH